MLIRKAGFSVGWVADVDDQGRTVWIVDAHRKGKRCLRRLEFVGYGVGVGLGGGVGATKVNTFCCNPVPIVGQLRRMMSESFVCWMTDSVAGSK